MKKAMTLEQRLADQIRRSHNGDAWHGPSLSEILDGLTAQQAAAQPIKDAHSIWELVVHVAILAPAHSGPGGARRHGGDSG